MTRKELNIKGLSEEVLDLLAGMDIDPYEKVNIELESHLNYIDNFKDYKLEEDDEYEEEIYDEEDDEEDIEFDTIPGEEQMPYPYQYDYMINHVDHINRPAFKGLAGLNKDIMPLQGKLVNTSKEELLEIANKLSEAKYGLDFDGDTTPLIPIFSTASLINRFGEDGYENLILKKVAEKFKEYGKLSEKDKTIGDALEKIKEGIFTPFGYNPIASKLTIDELRRGASENRFNLHLVNRDPRSGIIYGTLSDDEKITEKVAEEENKYASAAAKRIAYNMKQEGFLEKEESDRYLSEDTISNLKDIFNNFKAITNDKNLISETEKLLNKTIETIKTQGVDDNISLQFCNKMNHILIQSYINDICDLKKSIENEFGKSSRLDAVITYARRLNNYDRDEEVLACAITKPIYLSNLRDAAMNYLNTYTTNKVKEKYILSK